MLKLSGKRALALGISILITITLVIYAAPQPIVQVLRSIHVPVPKRCRNSRLIGSSRSSKKKLKRAIATRNTISPFDFTNDNSRKIGLQLQCRLMRANGWFAPQKEAVPMR
jgi:hypothetical protein